MSGNERLQPALFDRLIDDERTINCFRITVRRADLERLQLTVRMLADTFERMGLKLLDEENNKPQQQATLLLEFTAPESVMSTTTLKALVLRPRGAPQGVSVGSFCSVQRSSMLNRTLAFSRQSRISMRRLRDCVQRDLGWLLNTVSMESLQDLSGYDSVRRSVLNYGVTARSDSPRETLDVHSLAQRMAAAIELFEPRLQRVRVTPEPERARGQERDPWFRIEGDLWGQTPAQPLVFRVRIDMATGAVRISTTAPK
jgi:type VI secretion system protein ImpF